MSTPEPEWRVYGFPDLELLVFSNKRVLHSDNNRWLDLGANDSTSAFWTPGMLSVYAQVGRYCYEAGAHLRPSPDSDQA